jgi:hypothetical protein
VIQHDARSSWSSASSGRSRGARAPDRGSLSLTQPSPLSRAFPKSTKAGFCFRDSGRMTSKVEVTKWRGHI